VIDSSRSIAGTYTRRRVALVPDDGAIHCPNGHRITDSKLVWNDGTIRCKAQAPNGRENCSALVLLIGGGLRTLDGRTLILCAEVTPTELRTMREARMDITAMIAHLNLSWNPENR